jgi:hypothetical protein
MGLPADAKVMTFISTRDRAQAIDFYARALSAPLLREDDYGVVFDLNGVERRRPISARRSPLCAAPASS